MLTRIMGWLRGLFGPDTPRQPVAWQSAWSRVLEEKVAFYRALDVADRQRFRERCRLFLETTRIVGRDAEVTDEDRLLVAASAIIPVWGFPNWHYFNLDTVYLLAAPFNESFEYGEADSHITGMVGSGPWAGKMVLATPSLHHGFANARDKRNVGIHEFVHLVDMADGDCDGFPERLKEHAYSVPWFELVGRKIEAIEGRDSNIRGYGATNRAEFFAVASEYFFERPGMMKRKHPELFERLTAFYRQDVSAIAADVRIRKKDPCPCGSGKRYKRCCMPVD